MLKRLGVILERTLGFIQFCYLYLRNRPLTFYWVGDEGQPVGKPIEVFHLRLYDMMEHEAQGQMTAEVLLRGRKANAIQVLRFDPLNEMNGRTIIQPRWVEPEHLAAYRQSA